MMSDYQSRDQRLARQTKHGPRYAEDAGDLAKDWLSGPEGRRIQRNRRLMTALGSVLDQRDLSKVEPTAIRKGTLTLTVSDSLFMAELRNMHHSLLIAALIEHGTGIGHIVYRLKRSKR